MFWWTTCAQTHSHAAAHTAVSGRGATATFCASEQGHGGVHARAAALAAAACAAVLVRLEALRESVANAACLHRVFFQELASHARAHSAPGEPDVPPQSASGEDDHKHALHAFLEQHFLTDAVHDSFEVRALRCRHPY
jgi:hypothetical protein